MREISYTAARQQLASLLEQAGEDRQPVTITRRGCEPVVMVAADDYRSLVETAYLLRSPANAERLLRSIADSRAGRNVVEVDLDEIESRVQKDSR